MPRRHASKQGKAPPVPAKAALARARRSVGRRELQTALASFAHEVRTPLNGILVLAELLAASELSARERGWAMALKGAAEHLANLTTVVVDGARAENGTLVPRQMPFSPAELATTLGESLSVRAAAKGLAIELAVSERLPANASGDPVLIRAAVENLLDNAVKFTEAGCIRFACEADASSESAIRLTFRVTDQGVGLSLDEQRRLFRPFAQADGDVAHRYGGAGLGLVFARQVARAMRGDLTVASAPGAGSCFSLHVVVEAGEERSGQPEPPGRAGEQRPARALRILCVEDNPFGRAIFNAMLTPLGHSLQFVGSGEAAVSAAGGGGFDLVLMDVTLPGVDGLEAARRIRALKGPANATPIIGVSGRAGDEEERKALSAGMDAYLVKPVTPAALVAALAAAVGD
jgi:two-component system, sensor histidine kinase